MSCAIINPDTLVSGGDMGKNKKKRVRTTRTQRKWRQIVQQQLEASEEVIPEEKVRATERLLRGNENDVNIRFD